MAARARIRGQHDGRAASVLVPAASAERTPPILSDAPRAHDPAAAWRCAQRPSSALEAEVSGCVVSRVQGYHPRHRTNSCSDTPSAGRRGVTRARAQVRTLGMTHAARAGATSPASSRAIQVRHDREGSGGGLCGRAASVRETAVSESASGASTGFSARRMPESPGQLGPALFFCEGSMGHGHGGRRWWAAAVQVVGHPRK